MREVLLSDSIAALIDDADWPLVSQYRWRVYRHKTGKVYALGRYPGRHGKSVLLHRLILGSAAGSQVDHKNNNGLDNRRENLRPCTVSQNHANRHVVCGSSRFKGVCKRGRRWEAGIRYRRRTRYLGTFDEEVDAARAYDVAAKETFGEFARLNFGSA